jgi:hypothetical protein
MKRMTKQEAMGRVFVAVGKVECVREEYTDEREFLVLSPDLATLYGHGPTCAAAWVSAAHNTSTTHS